jgi:dihydroorotate dehydrogenase
LSLHDAATRLLRRLDPEDAHRLAVMGLAAGLGPRSTLADDPILAVEIAGLSLPNCLGLAAGFDKNAQAPDALLTAGFGFVECGTVTPRPQAGNLRPRLFRLNEDRAVINRMGFNNQGLEAFAGRLARRAGRPGVLGANLGANKESEDRTADYCAGLRRLWCLADYFTLNISSPNTPGLRALQGRVALDELLGRINEARSALTIADRPRPVFLKVAPDLESDEPAAIVEACLAHGVDGLIVSNTTLERPPSLRSSWRAETGGLSGAPLMAPSTEMLRRFAEVAQKRLVLIGVGGIGSGADALAKLRAGASAVQLYSALVYEGAGLALRLRRDLAAHLRAEGFASVAEAVGA